MGWSRARIRAYWARTHAFQTGEVYLKSALLLGCLALLAGYADPVLASERVLALITPHESAAHAGGIPQGAVLAAESAPVDSVGLALATAQPHAAPQKPAAAAPAAPTVIDAVAGAYCLAGRTASGTRAGPGSVAVDPTVIPLGSRLYVSGYGYGVAVDTGAAVRGRVVDVWTTCRSARRWGMRPVSITILGR